MGNKYKRVVPYSDESRLYKACGIITITQEKYPSFERSYINEKFDKIFCDLMNGGLISNYYFIYHVSPNNFHIHFAIDCFQQIRITTLCKKIAIACDIDTQLISIDKMISINAMLVYFLHRDKESKTLGKTEYQPADILSNLSLGEIELLLNAEDSFDLDYVTNVCANSHHEYDLIRKFGIKFFHKYRYELKIILEYTNIHLDKYHKTVEDSPF